MGPLQKSLSFHGLDGLRAVSPAPPWGDCGKPIKSRVSQGVTHTHSWGCHGSPPWMEERFNRVWSPPRVKLHLVGVAVGVAEVGVIVSVVRDGKEMPAFTLKMTAKQLIKGIFSGKIIRIMFLLLIFVNCQQKHFSSLKLME